jgi:regulation of enolase protein 1 (concanavalin A-like superfamily)
VAGAQPVEIAGLPFGLTWLGEPATWAANGSSLTITAGARSDWFVDPADGPPCLNAPALIGHVDGDFILSAHVEVEFRRTFDAGVLALWSDERTWAKLCFEYSPQGEPMVVSVVTRRVSDDCNSKVIAGNSVWLRIGRIGHTYAFHASNDGSRWEFVRYFAFGEGADIRVGFESQSPLGEGCTTRFTDISFSSSTLAELRDGS